MRRDMGRGARRFLALACVGFVAGTCTPAQGDSSEAADQSAARVASAPDSTVRQPAPGKAWVIFGVDTVRAEVARTEAQRAKGLMYRESVPDGTGMLFVFDQVGPQSFWMENTYVDLDIAFMDAASAVVDIQQMEHLTTTSHNSAAPALFALEVGKGWFEAHGVRVGSVPKIEFGPQLNQ